MDNLPCDGTERHRHYRIDTATYITHEHGHEPVARDFNILHHHNVFEHIGFELDDLKSSEFDTGEVPQYDVR